MQRGRRTSIHAIPYCPTPQMSNVAVKCKSPNATGTYRQVQPLTKSTTGAVDSSARAHPQTAPDTAAAAHTSLWWIINQSTVNSPLALHASYQANPAQSPLLICVRCRTPSLQMWLRTRVPRACCALHKSSWGLPAGSSRPGGGGQGVLLARLPAHPNLPQGGFDLHRLGGGGWCPRRFKHPKRCHSTSALSK